MEFDRNPYAAPDSASYSETGLPDYDSPPLAERATRLFAVWIDGFLYGGALLPGLVLQFVLRDPSSDDSSLTGVAAMLVPVLALAIYQWYLVSTTGQSLGKRWMQIKIVRTDGSPVTFVHAVLLRVWVVQALAIVPFIGSFISLTDALMIFGQERRCLHDRIAGTIVVKA